MNEDACACRAASSISSRVASGPSVADVFQNRFVEQQRFLRDHSQLAANVANQGMSEIDPVDQDRAGSGS